MKISLVIIQTLLALLSYGQQPEKVLYVVDSIPVLSDPDPKESTLEQADIETLDVVTRRDEITRYGFADFDKIIFIITKEYYKRPDDVKKIPTTKRMEQKNGQWYLLHSSSPFSGQFIDYFFNGKKQGEGTLKNGVLDGRRNVYYQNGNLSYYTHYDNGVETGESKEFFINGKIHQEGSVKNGKDDGLWKEWYSTGDLKRQTEFRDGKAISSKTDEKFHSLFSKGIELFRAGNYSGSIKQFDKAIELNANYSDVYFNRSLAYLYQLKFDRALVDSDKAIALEPFYMEAYSNRAFVRVRKYELSNSRVISKTKYATVLAETSKADIPAEELEKICKDLNKGIELGETSQMVLDARTKYCK